MLNIWQLWSSFIMQIIILWGYLLIMHPALNYEISLFLSHFSVLFLSMHGHRIPHEAPTEMHIDIKSCNTPNFYDTYHTFLTLCCIVLTTYCYKKHLKS